MAEPRLEVEALEVRYGAVPAVRDISLAVGEGEVVGLIGPNGAGKSTTLAAIMGLLRPARGSVRAGHGGSVGACSSTTRTNGLSLVAPL